MTPILSLAPQPLGLDTALTFLPGPLGPSLGPAFRDSSPYPPSVSHGSQYTPPEPLSPPDPSLGVPHSLKRSQPRASAAAYKEGGLPSCVRATEGSVSP